MTDRALAGLVVLDIGHGVTGPYAARLLGDLGADVVKLEQPGRGDFVRRQGTLASPGGRSVLFEALNWGKRSVELDLSDAGSRLRLEELLDIADIVITSLRPQTLSRWRLLPDDLLAVNPRLSVVSVTNFGLTGPKSHYQASDLVLNAAGGIMSISGSQDREPVKHGGNTSLFAAGLNAAYVALAGHWTSHRTGEGVAVDLAIRDCLASELVMNNAFHSLCGLTQGCPPPSSDPLDGNPLQAGKGYVSLQTSTRIPVSRFRELFDDLAFDNPTFQDAQDRIAHADELRRLLERHLSTRSAAELFETASSRGYLSGFVQGVDELLDCPQLAERGVYRSIEGRSPMGRGWVVPAAVVTMSDSPVRADVTAPRLGQHNGDHVVGRTSAWRPRPSGGGERTGPLSGIRVLDLSTVFAVPYLGALVADFGAEVIKVESPVRLDQTRTDWGGYFDNDPGEDAWNRGATFQVVNRGKKSAAVNLATEPGRALLRELVATSDIVLENFTPRVMRTWELTYDDLADINPRLIMLSNTGYGATGPWSSFKAQGTTLEATMGLMGVTGYPDGVPMRAGQSTPDFYACWAGLMALFAALTGRERTGRGQHIDLAMYQLGVSMLTDVVIEYQGSGRVPERIGARDTHAFVSGVYRTRDESGWLAVSVPESHRDRLRALLSRDGSGDASGDAAAVDEDVRRWVSVREGRLAERELQGAGIAASVVLDADGLAADPQLAARGFYERVHVRGTGSRRSVIGRPYIWQSSSTSVQIDGDAPQYGEHNTYVLGRLLGRRKADQAKLLSQGVVADRPHHVAEAKPIDAEAAAAAGTFHPAHHNGAQP